MGKGRRLTLLKSKLASRLGRGKKSKKKKKKVKKKSSETAAKAKEKNKNESACSSSSAKAGDSGRVRANAKRTVAEEAVSVVSKSVGSGASKNAALSSPVLHSDNLEAKVQEINPRKAQKSATKKSAPPKDPVRIISVPPTVPGREYPIVHDDNESEIFLCRFDFKPSSLLERGTLSMSQNEATIDLDRAGERARVRYTGQVNGTSSSEFLLAFDGAQFAMTRLGFSINLRH